MRVETICPRLVYFFFGGIFLLGNFYYNWNKVQIFKTLGVGQYRPREVDRSNIKQ